MNDNNAPYVVSLKKDDEIYICQCGKTSNAPLCDGSHKGSEGRPLGYQATKDEELYVCGCGKSANMPWCDGSHK
ncbi:MAG: CDGSH iron-sulfur domain-containing protein [Cycloclasticus sp.]|nr:CDGSH iron-sulfur domain-containing protein [Cycloclasticus sp.]